MLTLSLAKSSESPKSFSLFWLPQSGILSQQTPTVDPG